MNSEQRLLIKKNLDILLRRKKTIVFFLLLAMALGIAYYVQAPKTFQSNALIRYERQNINPMAMTADNNRTLTRDVINTVSLQITSRSSLEGIILEYDLYKSMRETMPMEDIVDIMKEYHITAKPLEGGDVFEVTYLGLDQQKVMDVTNALAQKFIEENLRSRQAQASQTSTYIRDELKIAKAALDEKEQIMRDYKLRYYNEMPDQLVNNTTRLNGAQTQYHNLQSSRLQLEQTRLLVQEQIAARIATMSQQMMVSATATPAAPADGVSSVEQIRLRLQNLQPRYTDNHPEIKRLKKLLENLEKQQSAPVSLTKNIQDPQIMELKQQLKDIEFNINRLNNERQVLTEELSKYEKWIAAAPVREAEWSALTRDYDQLNEHYQMLFTQGLQAESVQSSEQQLQGSQFKIIDPAHFPEKPLHPNFLKILLMAVGLGLGIGGGASFGLELLGTSFKDPADIEKYLDIPVVCALPRILTKKETLKKNLSNTFIVALLFLFGAAILGATIYLWQLGIVII